MFSHIMIGARDPEGNKLCFVHVAAFSNPNETTRDGASQ